MISVFSFPDPTETTSSKEMIPSRTTPTTAAESQDQTTTVKPPPYVRDGDNGKQEVEAFFFYKSFSLYMLCCVLSNKLRPILTRAI